MIGLTSEITDEVSFGRRDNHLHPCPRGEESMIKRLAKDTSRGNEPT